MHGAKILVGGYLGKGSTCDPSEGRAKLTFSSIPCCMKVTSDLKQELKKKRMGLIRSVALTVTKPL